MEDSKRTESIKRRASALALILCAALMMLFMATGVIMADDGDEGQKELSIEVVEDIPAQDIEEQAVPLAAGPVSERSDAVRHAALMGLLLLGTAPVRNPDGADREPGHSTILLAGTDQGGSRTDTIMLLSLERGGRLRLLSIPRDTYVPNYTSRKLNAVYGAVGGGEAGMELLMDETAKLLGFAPDGYALVDMDVVVRAVDILGGADYDVPQDMDYDDAGQDLSIHLRAGEQHLNGEQVLDLLRFRSGYADADIGRTAVQRDFLRQALDQWLRPSHLRQLPALLSLFHENVSSSLRFRNLMWIARVLLKADLKDMDSQVLPGWADMADGSSVYMVDRSAAAEMLREYSPYVE